LTRTRGQYPSPPPKDFFVRVFWWGRISFDSQVVENQEMSEKATYSIIAVVTFLNGVNEYALAA